MRRLFIWIVPLLSILLCSAAMGEERSYADALAAWRDAPKAVLDISVPLDGFETQDVGLTEETIDGEKALCWRTGIGSVSFRVNVPERALYQLSVRYAQLDGSSGQIERGIKINGQAPYAESAAFLFPKQFEDAQYPFARNEYGNEIRPRQNGVLTAQEIMLSERSGLQTEPMLFLLEQGENTLTFTGIKGSLAILGVTLKAPVSLPSYAEYREIHQNKPAAAEVLIVEAEQIFHRSSKSIQNLTFSNPGVTPSEAGRKLLNAIGGSSWNSAQDYVEWQIDAPRDALYCLGFHYVQNFNVALTAFRAIQIDGEIPFAEFSAVGFPFGSSWETLVPGGEEPYLVYLTQGVHTLRLTATNAPYARTWRKLGAVVDEMKKLDLYVTEIIGSDSDVYRIWKLERYIPTIAEDLNRMVEELEDVRDQLKEITGAEGSLGTLDAAIQDLKKLAADHNRIAKRSDSLSSIYTTLSNWEDNMMSQPLALNRISLAGGAKDIPSGQKGFWEGLAYDFRNFTSSFFSRDDAAVRDDGETVNVWV